MSFSRFSVLAVFLMMVLSAFVAVPNQYVGGEHEEGTEHGAYFVYIMTTDRSDAITEATPFTLDFPAPPMADNAPYELELICEGDDEGFIDGIYGTWVTSQGGNAGDFNNITSWEVWNTNGIQLEKFAYNPMSDIIDFEHPMVVFEDNESSGGGHLPAEVFDQEEFYCPEGTMPVHDYSDSDDMWDDFYQQNITIEMVNLNEWNITVENVITAEKSNELRYEVAQMCASALGTDADKITSECFEYFLESMDDEHGGHHMSGCSPEWGLNETECETFMEECDDGGFSMACFYIMYELCIATDDGGEVCDHFGEDDGHDHDDSDEHHHHGDGDEHHDHDGDDDHTHEESDRHHNHDGADMLFSFMTSVIGYDMGYEDSSNVVNAVDELMGGFNSHHDIEDIAHYDVYHFNITEEEVANYTVDIDGAYNESTDDWFEPSYVYLYEGTHDIPSDADEFEGNQRICEYGDATEMYVDCYHILSTHLEVGSYSLFVTNSCSHVWTYNESSEEHEFDGYECHYGSYNLSVHNDDNDTHVDNMVGEISNLDPIFILGESHELHREASQEFAFFPFYETHTYTVTGDDNVSKFYSEQDVDYNQTMIVWLYAGSFTETDWSENLMYVSSGYENYNGTGAYNFSAFDLSELNEHPGDYVFVTTGQHTHSGGTYEAYIWSDDGTVLDSWSGELCGDYHHTCEDTTEADDRAYFTFAHHYYYQENDDEGDDDGLWTMFYMSLVENMSAYDDGDISEEEFADRVVDLLHEMAEMGAFEGDGGAPSPEEALEATDANGDGYMSFEEFQDHWEAQNDTGDLDWSDVQVLFSDADTNDDDLLEIDELQHFIDGIEDMTSGYGPDVGDCPFDNVEFCHEIGNFCDGDMEYWPHSCLIEFGEELAHYCLENEDSGCEIVIEVCDDASGVNATVCEGYSDFNHDAYHGNEGMPTLNGFQGIVEPHDWQDNMAFMNFPVLDRIGNNSVAPITIGTNFTLHFDDAIADPYFFELLPVGGHSFHCSSTVGGEPDTEIDFSLVNNGVEDCGDGADEPQDTDGDGETDNWFDCHDGSQVSMEVVNDGVDDCPDGDDEGHYENIYVKFDLLEGYEVIECIGCEDYTTSTDGTISFFVQNGTFRIHFDNVSDIPACPENASGAPVCVCNAGFDGNLTFDEEDGWSGTCVVIEEEPEAPVEDEPVLPDCDVTIGMNDADYAFNPVSVEIDFGQTVCWQWTNSTEPHNVAQVAESSDTTKLSSGFYSGAANVSGDFRVTFDAAGGYSDDTTYYYICEPHATMGMVGEVVVGTGSTDPELEEALEESGIPSVSFIVGILVLVGAAGLRRRIH